MFPIQLKILLKSFRFLLKWQHRISSFDSFKYVFLLHRQVHVLHWYLDSDEIISTGSNVINRTNEWHSLQAYHSFGEGLLFSGTVAIKTSLLSDVNVKRDVCLLLELEVIHISPVNCIRFKCPWTYQSGFLTIPIYFWQKQKLPHEVNLISFQAETLDFQPSNGVVFSGL